MYSQDAFDILVQFVPMRLVNDIRAQRAKHDTYHTADAAHHGDGARSHVLHDVESELLIVFWLNAGLQIVV